MKKIIYILSILAISGRSDQNRAFLSIKVCPEKYIVDEESGIDLNKLIVNAKPGWASVQIQHPEFINEQRLVAAKNQIHQFSPASAVGVIKSTGNICNNVQ